MIKMKKVDFAHACARVSLWHATFIEISSKYAMEEVLSLFLSVATTN